MSGPSLAELFAVFPEAAVPVTRPVVDVPEPYRGLLVHDQHMTVTVERFHADRVNVRVLATHRTGDHYTRMILLERQGDGVVVQFGIVRIRLDLCSPPVRAAILAEHTPLGRVLIEHDVLRRIEPTAFFLVEPGAATEAWFGPGRATYGRLGIIHCDGLPAIELLEIVKP